MLKNFKSVKSTDENGNILYKAYNLGLTDEEYDALKPVIGFLNGCWREKEKCFVFGYNPDEILKDMFEMWKKQTLEYYTSKPVTHKEIEELDFETRIGKRDELLAKKFSSRKSE